MFFRRRVVAVQMQVHPQGTNRASSKGPKQLTPSNRRPHRERHQAPRLRKCRQMFQQGKPLHLRQRRNLPNPSMQRRKRSQHQSQSLPTTQTRPQATPIKHINQSYTRSPRQRRTLLQQQQPTNYQNSQRRRFTQPRTTFPIQQLLQKIRTNTFRSKQSPTTRINTQRNQTKKHQTLPSSLHPTQEHHNHPSNQRTLLRTPSRTRKSRKRQRILRRTTHQSKRLPRNKHQKPLRARSKFQTILHSKQDHQDNRFNRAQQARSHHRQRRHRTSHQGNHLSRQRSRTSKKLSRRVRLHTLQVRNNQHRNSRLPPTLLRATSSNYNFQQLQGNRRHLRNNRKKEVPVQRLQQHSTRSLEFFRCLYGASDNHFHRTQATPTPSKTCGTTGARIRERGAQAVTGGVLCIYRRVAPCLPRARDSKLYHTLARTVRRHKGRVHAFVPHCNYVGRHQRRLRRIVHLSNVGLVVSSGSRRLVVGITSVPTTHMRVCFVSGSSCFSHGFILASRRNGPFPSGSRQTVFFTHNILRAIGGLH